MIGGDSLSFCGLQMEACVTSFLRQGPLVSLKQLHKRRLKGSLSGCMELPVGCAQVLRSPLIGSLNWLSPHQPPLPTSCLLLSAVLGDLQAWATCGCVFFVGTSFGWFNGKVENPTIFGVPQKRQTHLVMQPGPDRLHRKSHFSRSCSLSSS